MITQELLKTLIQYDPLTGEFYWLVSKGAAKRGRPAGVTSNRYGKYYRTIMINGKSYQAHRLEEISMPEQTIKINVPEGYEAITLNAGDEYGNPLTILIKLQKEEPEPPK